MIYYVVLPCKIGCTVQIDTVNKTIFNCFYLWLFRSTKQISYLKLEICGSKILLCNLACVQIELDAGPKTENFILLFVSINHTEKIAIVANFLSICLQICLFFLFFFGSFFYWCLYEPAYLFSCWLIFVFFVVDVQLFAQSNVEKSYLFHMLQCKMD